MKTIKYISKWFVISSLACLSTAMMACDDNEPDPQPQVTLAGSTPIYYNTEQRWLQVQAIGNWTLALTFADGQEPWCTVAPASGSGNANVVLSMLSKNEGENSRLAELQLTSQGTVVTTTLEQVDESYTDVPPVNPPAKVVDQLKVIPKWLELPLIEKPYKGQSAVVAHGNTINGKAVRNYTMLYDTTKFLAYWVAYPLYASSMGDAGRNKTWYYDPKIPSAYQINVVGKSYPDKNAPGPYDRGHQLRSDDRTATTAENKQTFYVSNQTAQVARFNQLLWLTLENKVQAWALAADTLYVVTGAHLAPGYRTTPDNSDKAIPVPTHYYKVLLSYKMVSGVATYKAIGFLFENKEYPNQLTSTYTKTVADLETFTGFTFFANLPADIKNRIRTEYNPQAWGIQ